MPDGDTLTPVDTSPEALAVAREREAATEASQREAAEAAKEAFQAYLRADDVSNKARRAAEDARWARVLLVTLSNSMPGTAVELTWRGGGIAGWAWRTPAGLPMYLAPYYSKTQAAPSTAYIGPGPELEGRVPDGRKWRTLAELGPRQQVAAWRLRG